MIDLKQVSVQPGVDIGECVYLPTINSLIADGDRRFLKSGSLIVNSASTYPDAYSSFSGYRRNISTSNWVANTPSTTAAVLGLSFTNGWFFLNYVDFTTGTPIYYVVTSKDAVTWTQVTNPFGTANSYIRDIAYGNGIYVAMDDAGNIAYSNNVTGPWTKKFVGGNGGFNAIWYSVEANLWMMVGQNGWVAKATTDMIWTTLQIGVTMHLNDITYIPNGVWYAVGRLTDDTSTSTVCGYYSTNTTSWNNAQTVIGKITAIEYNAKFGYALITNGATVAFAVIPTTPLTPLAWDSRTSSISPTSGTGFIAMADDTAIVCNLASGISSSTNGINWATVPPMGSVNFQDIVYGNNRFVTLGGDRKISVAADDNVLGINTAIVDGESTLYMRVK